MNAPFLPLLALTTLGVLSASPAPAFCQVSSQLQPPARPTPSALLQRLHYTVDAFGYDDPHPPGYHPLGEDTVGLLQRSEIFIAQPDRGPGDSVADLLDDAGTSYAIRATETDFVLATGRIRATTAGNVDSDVEDELIVLMQDPALDRFHLQVFDSPAPTATAIMTVEIVRPFGEDCVDGRLSVGDVDGDGRDEILVTGRPQLLGIPEYAGWLRVYDDVEDGGGLLFETAYGFRNTDVTAVAADIDGDGVDEVAMFGENSHYGDLWILPFDDAAAAAPFAQLGDWFRAEAFGITEIQGRLTAGDYDGNGVEELAVVSMVANPSGGGRRLTMGIRGVFLNGAGQLETVSLHSSDRGQHSLGGAFELHRSWDAVTRSDGPGSLDTIVTVAVLGSGAFRPDTHRWNSATASWSTTPSGNVFFASGPLRIKLEAGDVDADGADEVVVGSQFAIGGEGILRARILDWSQGAVSTTELPERISLNQRVYPPSLAVGDFDGDGLIIRSTGIEQITLADPIPLVLLTAPPTRGGIDQDYDSCETSYQNSTSQEVSLGVTTSAAFSFYTGVTTGPLSDFASAEVKQTLEQVLTKNDVSTSSTTVFRTNTAGHAEDVMVFQGTLFHGYEYEVVSASDPDDVGKRMVLSIPVGTREYQWSADLYNQVVGPALAIPTDLRPHTVGDPASYRSLVELDAHRQPFVGWRDHSVVTVPQSGSTRLGFALTERQTTEEERSLSIGIDADFSVGFASFGSSASVTGGSMYSVSVEETAEYSGTLGAIGDPSDYFRWQYEAGLCMYHYGMDATSGQAQPGVTPFQVVTYWVNAFGSGY
ncbi:FG-GAP repeat domain-containing protein [Planctomycetes bacterium Poly30]